ncbi:hypothetical protein D3C86_1568970 [compost metagenome]
MQRHQALVDRATGGSIATHGGGAQLAHRSRSDVGGHRNVALGAHQHQLDRGGVVAGVDQEAGGDLVQHFLATLQVAGGFLDADDVRHRGQAGNGVGQHVAGGTPRHVVEDLRNGHRLGDLAVVQVQAFLGRLVVVRGDQQAGIDAGLLGGGGQFDGLAGGVGPGTGDHRNASGDLLDHVADHRDVFVDVQRGGLTRGADRDDGVGAFLEVKIDQLGQAIPIQTAFCIHGRDQCHHAARNHATTPAAIEIKA